MREYDIGDLASHSSSELAQFSEDMAMVLGEMAKCPQKVKDTFRYGYALTDLKISNNRNGDRTAVLSAKGNYPMPLGTPFTVDMTVKSTVIKSTRPAPPDAPEQRDYTCTVDVK